MCHGLAKKILNITFQKLAIKNGYDRDFGVEIIQVASIKLTARQDTFEIDKYYNKKIHSSFTIVFFL
jgi:hypothetical protein